MAAAGVLVLGGCATAPPAPSGPVVSPTGIVYELGTPPVETRFSQTAALYLRSGTAPRALELAREGIEADPTNPVHYFLAGVALARMGEYEEADRMLSEAQRIYPAYELDIEPEREAAWAEAFNQGTSAYRAGDVDAAIEALADAARMFELRPEAHRNLARLLASESRYDEAIEVYQRAIAGLEKVRATRAMREDEVRERREGIAVTEESLAQLLLFRNRFAEAEPLLRRQLLRDSMNVQVRSNLGTALSGQGKNEEAREIYASLLSEADLEATQLFNLGVALFRSSDFPGAGRAFQRLTELQPYSRDAWFNYANSLFAAQAWDSLALAGDRLLELDPLSENAALITARAHLEKGDERTALGGVERIKGVPVHVEGLLMRPGNIDTKVQGRVTGNVAEPGTPVHLLFTFYGENGVLGSETVTVPAPDRGDRQPFEVSFGMRAMAYRYELVP